MATNRETLTAPEQLPTGALHRLPSARLNKPSGRPDTVAVGVIVWLASELMFFGALFAAYFWTRSITNEAAAPGQPTMWALTPSRPSESTRPAGPRRAERHGSIADPLAQECESQLALPLSFSSRHPASAHGAAKTSCGHLNAKNHPAGSVSDGVAYHAAAAQWKESPQAQEPPALGLSIVKPCFSIVSRKSMLAPPR